MSVEKMLRGIHTRLDKLERGGKSGWPGTDQGTVLTSESLTVGAYADLVTVGPAAKVEVSESSIVVVLINAEISSGSGEGSMSFAVTDSDGNVLRAATDACRVWTFIKGSGVAMDLLSLGYSGTITLTAKYKADGVHSVSFLNRRILAIPI